MNTGVEWSILLPALLAGLLVLASHVPLGQRVLERGIIFIDIAIAQFAGLGLILAHFLGWEGGWQGQAAALVLAAVGALMLHGTERRWPRLQEAIIGVSFVLVASVAILLLAQDAHGGEHLREMLVGQILWTTWDDLPLLALLNGLVLAAWFGGLHKSALGFYLLFALAITASVQVVGVYLVFASLIVPALVAHAKRCGRALLVGYLTGAVGYALGLLASARWDLPAGAVIVCALVVAACVVTVWRSMLRPVPG
ncbi:MAG: zinc/manganese transport system permease protein [bacterium]|nr:MAG: zinc/manganese transport system permease protein [bacterium]KAF0147368.1 MAG: zinc/manganese transport system permease protein [bacterium]KAF0167219.1 MAG: zinc/manganese transport system permease protein [bacterium]TXT19226.1 MAG: zinc/manganese transport system permease protein [bacterium]